MKGSTQKESGNIDVDFENSLKDNPFMGINAIEFPYDINAYSDLNVVPFNYELFERSLISSNYTKLYRKRLPRWDI